MLAGVDGNEQNGLGFPSDAGNFVGMGINNVAPQSRESKERFANVCSLTSLLGGSVKLGSSDPLAHPLIDPNYLSSEVDLAIFRESVRSARRFFAAPAWSGYILEAQNNATTDEELNAFFRETAGTAFHAVSTASMSPFNATWGVVDPDLKVKGVRGLRIVDASVMVSKTRSFLAMLLGLFVFKPRIPAAHTSAPTYALSERAADIIKADYGVLMS